MPKLRGRDDPATRTPLPPKPKRCKTQHGKDNSQQAEKRNTTTVEVSKVSKVPDRPPQGTPSRIDEALAELRVMGDGGTQKSLILAKILKHLKAKFLQLEDEAEPLNIHQLLSEISATNIALSTKEYLVNDGLPNSEKVTVTGDKKYIYKPPVPCRDRKSLLRFLKLNHENVGGGIMKDDISDSISCADSILRALVNDGAIIIVSRMDNKEIVFFNKKEPSLEIEVDEVFKEFYRSISIAGLDSKKLEAYLRERGLNPILDVPKIKIDPKKTKPEAQRKPRTTKNPKDNVHVADQLRNYGDGLDEVATNKNVGKRNRKLNERKPRKCILKTK